MALVENGVGPPLKLYEPNDPINQNPVVEAAILASDGGKILYSHLQIGGCIVKVFEGRTGLEIQITATNGTSYWDLNGNNICGYHPDFDLNAVFNINYTE